MAWKRDSDTNTFDPRVLAVIEHPAADGRSVNEVWGFFERMASWSAQHTTDYVVSFPAALACANNDRDRLELLWDQCEFAGLGHVIVLDNGRRAFRLVNDPEFVHIKTAEETTFERQRKADNSEPHLTVRIRMRDGDACRYCGHVVWFTMRKGDKRGTYDHRPPGQPGTAETSVVACGACNSGRGGLSKGLPPAEGLIAADEKYPLLPEPLEPYWSPSTREWLGKHAQLLGQYGLVPPPLAGVDEQPLKAGSPAPGADPAPSGVRPATGAGDGPASAPGAADAPDVGAQPATARSPGRSGRSSAGSAGSGRNPPGSAGTGRNPPVAPLGSAGSGRSGRNLSTPGRFRQIPAEGKPSGSGSGRTRARTGRDGTGRAGPGLVGPGLDGAGLDGAGQVGAGQDRQGEGGPDRRPLPRRRGRRGDRRRGGGGG